MADKTIDDGGPAFSGGLFEPQTGGSNDREPWNPGMSLRDWFAGQAISGVIRQCAQDLLYQPDTTPADYFAKKAFEIADAMIAARKGGA